MPPQDMKKLLSTAKKTNDSPESATPPAPIQEQPLISQMQQKYGNQVTSRILKAVHTKKTNDSPESAPSPAPMQQPFLSQMQQYGNQAMVRLGNHMTEMYNFQQGLDKQPTHLFVNKIVEGLISDGFGDDAVHIRNIAYRSKNPDALKKSMEDRFDP